MSDDVMRGIPLLIIGSTTLCFALSLIVYSRRRNGALTWPVPWNSLTALYLGSLGMIALLSGVRRLDPNPDVLSSRWVTVATWIAAVLSVATFGRWLRDERKDGA